jgi:hypothetical protein
MMPKRLRACGLPRGPNIRMRLFGWVPVASPSFREADGRPDVVAEDRLAGVDIAGEHGVDAFAQQRSAEGGIACDPLCARSLKLRVSAISCFRQSHRAGGFRSRL